MITLRVGAEQFRAELSAMAARLRQPTGLMRVLGREAGNQLKSHFRLKQQREPNRLGGKRTNFWRAVASSVQSPTISGDGTEATVAVSHPAIAQKVFGGRIRAKRARTLTIPVSPEAYGRTASTFEAETGLKLFLVQVGIGNFKSAVLASQRDGGGMQIEYVLKREVTQDPDPTALPPEAALAGALLRRAQLHVDRITAGDQNA